MRVSWLNLHKHVPLRDVRRLIYSYLEPCDREMVEMAHGTRKRVSFKSVVQMTERNYFDLVQYIRKRRLFMSWYWPSIGAVIEKHCDPDFVKWFAMCAHIIDWELRYAILKQCIFSGYDSLVKTLCLEYGWHRHVPMYAYFAQANNLSLAKWFYWKFPDQTFLNGYTISVVIEHATLDFLIWMQEKLDIMREVTLKQRDEIFDKWPEFKVWHLRKKSKP